MRARYVSFFVAVSILFSPAVAFPDNARADGPAKVDGAFQRRFGGEVAAAGATDQQTLVWDAATHRWIPGSGGSVTSAALDSILGSTRGGVAERGASGWTEVLPGTAGLPLVSAGSGADPLYAVLGVSGGGTGASTGSGNVVFASPANGSSGALSLRALVAADVPSLDASKITTGQLAVALGGTGVATVGSDKFFGAPLGSTGAPAFRAIDLADLGGVSLAGGDLQGTLAAPTVAFLRGRQLSTTAPTNGQAYAWNAATSLWTPTTISGGGASGWSYSSPAITLATATDHVGIGTSPAGARKLDVLGDATYHDIYMTAGAGGSFNLFNATGTGVQIGANDYIQWSNANGAGFSLYPGGDFVTNDSGNALAQNATAGFLWVPQCLTGAPTGTPASSVTGAIAEQWGGDNHRYGFYSGAWHQLDGAAPYPLTITAQTSDTTLAVNTFNSNTGASANVQLTLPSSPATGTIEQGFVTANHYLKIKAPSSTVIYAGTTASATAGYWRSTSIGSTFFLVYVGSNTWFATLTGDWTVDS